MKSAVSIRTTLSVIWLLVVGVIVLLAFHQPAQFDSSIMSLLPKSQQQPLVQQAVDQSAEGFSKGVILLLSGDDESDVQQAVHELAGSLSSMPDVASLRWRVESDEIEKLQTSLFPFRFVVLDEQVRATLRGADFEQISEQALWRVYSPIKMGKGSLTEDPFALYSKLTMSREAGLNLQVTNDLFKVSGVEKPTYMLMVILAVEPFSPSLQQRMLSTLNIQQTKFESREIQLKKSGMLMHAAAGAEQAKAEISTIGLGSLLGVVLLIWLIFRQFKPLLLMMFAVLLGCLCATAITLLVFERVHLITFAFGAGLVGVSIDYAMHYLCESRVSGSGDVLRKLLPGLALGLLSSVLAYGSLLLTPFPGLQQMAVFSVVGLMGAWLTVVICFPQLTGTMLQKKLNSTGWLVNCRESLPIVQRSPVLVTLLIALFCFSAVSLWKADTADDIRLLQTSPKTLLAEEQAVQQVLGVNSSAQFLLIQGLSLEQCLQLEEKLQPELRNLLEKHASVGYQSLSGALPSLKRQSENRQLVEQLYDHQLTEFFDRLSLPSSALLNAQANFEDSKSSLLTADHWLTQEGNSHWGDLIVENGDGSTATIIRFNGDIDETLQKQLAKLADFHPGVSYINQVQNISNLMSDYRNQMLYWVLLAYFLIGAILFVRYKVQTWRILLPPLLASIFTLAILVQIQHSVNLFHLMALILVLGIGLDMGIFLTETSGAHQTWLAVTLSALTSLLAFGLLALSKTPVLHHFGLTVLLALVFTWLLAAVMRKPTFGEINT